VLDAETYAKKGSVKLIPGADSAGYDAVANIWYIVTGGKDVDMKTAEIEAINPDTGQKLGQITSMTTTWKPWRLRRAGTVSSLTSRRPTNLPL